MLEYSEYKTLIDTLEQSNHDLTYQEVMKKESKVLDTINKSIQVFNDQTQKQKQFINKPVSEIVFNFFNTWIEIIQEITTKADSITSLINILNTKDRLVYIGVSLIVLSIIFFYMEITSS
jgi:hypothetical protein